MEVFKNASASISATDRCIVRGPNDEVLCVLNPLLLIRQNINDEALEALKLSHQLKHLLFEAAKKTTNKSSLRLLAAHFDELEYHQQELWGFPQDENYHRFFDFPGCTCPKMDNEDRLGTAFKIYQDDCPIHGLEEE